MTPVLRFIVYLVIQDGRVGSMRTIKSYAASLLDYFSFLEANNIAWNESYRNDTEHFSLSPIALYRNWSVKQVDENGRRTMSDSTINLRLSVLKRFYEYCHDTALIKHEPWEVLFKVRPEKTPRFFKHTRGQKIVSSNDLVLKTFKKQPKLISLEQCKKLISVIDNLTIKLITKLILSSGLRKDEVISFTSEHIFKPDLSNLNRRVPINLEPQVNGQRTKGSKPRRIYISVVLMSELWDYLNIGERVIRGKIHKTKHGHNSAFVFLNRFGDPYSEKSLNNAYTRLYTGPFKKINFKVSPHMLRHTYATIELYSESQRVGTTKALAWVQKRLGHSSISTTSIYLHCIEALQDFELSRYQAELDAME
ncbi:site-specific recombinase, phage integrase family protein [Vibrio sp. MED222]|nr:site-specific recombinase, phage integrase family protein [Vibrio sp. MED222]